jgi:hypothetical protein
MNIFVLDNNPMKAAQAMDCVRVPKMVVESAQMMASALRRWGATDDQMPIAKTSGKPYRGGYKHHPCTIWAGDTRANYAWLALHALQLSTEYMKRFSKVHACHEPIQSMVKTGMMEVKGPIGELTPFAQAMPDEYKHEDAVTAYRAYYHSKIHSAGGVHYRHTNPPDWWMGVTQ